MQDWKVLQTRADLEEAKQRSFSKPVIIFKHSTRCGISMHAHSEMNTLSDAEAEAVEIYYLDLLQFRPLSNLIAEEFDVMHQSPQLIALKNGKAVKSTSHAGVRPAFVAEIIA